MISFKRFRNTFLALISVGLLAVTFAAQANTTITRYVMTDPQGNPVAITDSAGVVIWRQSYTPYGQTYQQADPDGPGFTGHRNDATTGLVYMQARYYDPKIGRFLSVDPVAFSPGQPQFFNRYWYAQGNPYKYTDPDGRDPMMVLTPEGPILLLGPPITGQGGLSSQSTTSNVLVHMQDNFNQNTSALGSAIGIAVWNATHQEERNTETEQPKTSDRVPGSDGKKGSTSGPGAGKRFSPESAETKASKEGVPCRYCGKTTTNKSGQPNSRERDHIDPKSRGGNNSSENERDSCRTCNRSKGAKTPDEWDPAHGG